MYDLLGLSKRIPSFVKNYMETAESIQQALSNYVQEVKSGAFPAEEHCLD